MQDVLFLYGAPLSCFFKKDTVILEYIKQGIYDLSIIEDALKKEHETLNLNPWV